MNDLVIFDLDDTLLPVDSEFHFTKFIVSKGMLDKDLYLKKIKSFFVKEKIQLTGNSLKAALMKKKTFR